MFPESMTAAWLDMTTSGSSVRSRMMDRNGIPTKVLLRSRQTALL